MARTLTCDICKRTTTGIAGKLFYLPTENGKRRLTHSEYTHHADIGVCCVSRVLELFNFQPRMKRSSRREEPDGARASVGKDTKAKASKARRKN